MINPLSRSIIPAVDWILENVPTDFTCYPSTIGFKCLHTFYILENYILIVHQNSSILLLHACHKIQFKKMAKLWNVPAIFASSPTTGSIFLQ